jgi:hypothetical protein
VISAQFISSIWGNHFEGGPPTRLICSHSLLIQVSARLIFLSHQSCQPNFLSPTQPRLAHVVHCAGMALATPNQASYPKIYNVKARLSPVMPVSHRFDGSPYLSYCNGQSRASIYERITELGYDSKYEKEIYKENFCCSVSPNTSIFNLGFCILSQDYLFTIYPSTQNHGPLPSR